MVATAVDNRKGVEDSGIWADMAAAQRGCDDYWDHIRKYIYSISLTITNRNTNESDELTQDALAMVYRKIGQYDEKRHPKNWLWAITKHIWIDEQRKKTRHKTLSYDRTVPGSSGSNSFEIVKDESQREPYLEYIRREQIGMLNRTIEYLTSRGQSVELVLDRARGLSQKVMAERYGLVIGTIKSRIFTQRKILCEELLKVLGTDPKPTPA